MIPSKNDREKQELQKKRVHLETLIRDKKREAALKHQAYLFKQNRAIPLEREVKMMAQNIKREHGNADEVRRLEEKKKGEATSLERQLIEKNRQKKILDNEVTDLERKDGELKRKNSSIKNEAGSSAGSIEVDTIETREKGVQASLDKERQLLRSELLEIDRIKNELRSKEAEYQKEITHEKGLESELARLLNEKRRMISLAQVRSSTKNSESTESSLLESKLKKQKSQDELLQTEIVKLERELAHVKQEVLKLEKDFDVTGYKDIKKTADRGEKEKELENLTTESAKDLEDAKKLDAEVKKLELELQRLPRV